MWRSIRFTVLIAAVSGLPGCASQEPVITYEPTVAMADLAPGVPSPDNTYRLLADEPTRGRFACGLAVAKFVPHDNDNGLNLEFEAMRPAEQAYWTEQFRGVWAIRKVMFLSPFTVRPNEPTVDNLCATANELGASLLMVYTPNGLGPNSAQVLGVLYDVPTRAAVAALHASSRFIDLEEGVEVSPNQEKGDHRDIDARYQAQREFEEHVLACVAELIRRDTPPPTTQPHRWHKPLVERWWIPGRGR